MNINRLQIVLVSVALLASAVLAEVLAPRELMARTSAAIDLEKAIPRQFGGWSLVPNIQLVTPSDPVGVVDPEAKFKKIYSQEVGRTYVDQSGQIVMLMVAYGPVQNYRLKAHRPEICYTSSGFRISNKHGDSVTYSRDREPLKLTRLIAERESRFEPITYWMRVGNDIATGIIDRQIIRLKYGLRGIIPDGALIRISTVGLSEDVSFKVQDQFIRDLLAAIAPQDRRFFVGT